MSNAWQKILLGKGAFGIVTLFQNTVTEEKLVVKEAHDENMTEKMKERWGQECLIMPQLNHPNIVKGLHLPDSLRTINEGPCPVLTMEYCNMQDLRVKLLKSINMYGLEEHQVKRIGHDVTEAVVYLHANNIYHRDLKPENIVLNQLPEERVVYKVTDLGYAKDISDTSSCYSLVGTLQYLAPELLTDKSYDGKVDYWSLATTLFECATGFRPFAPTANKESLNEVIRLKEDSDIYVHMENQSLKFHQVLPHPTRLCSHTKERMETWFRLMLRFDPRLRGGKMDGGTLECFSLLNEMLHLKVLTVHKPQTMESFWYDLTNNSELSEHVISMYEGGACGNPLLIDRRGKVVDGDYDLGEMACQLDYGMIHNEEHEESVLYRFGSEDQERWTQRVLNPILHALLSDNLRASNKISWFQQQFKCSKLLTYHTHERLKDTNKLADSLHALCAYYEEEKNSLETLRDGGVRLCALKEFTLNGINCDLEHLGQLPNSEAVDSLMEKFEARRVQLVEEKMTELFESTFKKCLSLEKDIGSSLSQDINGQYVDYLNKHHQEALKIEKDLKKMPHDRTDRVDVIEEMKECLKECGEDFHLFHVYCCQLIDKIIKHRNNTLKLTEIIHSTTNHYKTWQDASKNRMFSLFSSIPQKADSSTQELCMQSLQLIKNVEKMFNLNGISDITS